MDKLEKLKQAMDTAYNTFFETEDDNFIDKFYQSDFIITFDNKTDGKKYSINLSCSPEVWDFMPKVMKMLEESEDDIKYFIY